MLRLTCNNVLNIKRKSKMQQTKHYCDILPVSEIRIIKNNVKANQIIPEEISEKPTEDVSKEFRLNEVNIQMISRNLFEQLFKVSTPAVDSETIKMCQQNLIRHGIEYKNSGHMPDVELKLPPLEGKDIVEHFYNIAEIQCTAYRQLLQNLANSKQPPQPKIWSKKAGWHKYLANGEVIAVPYPSDDALIFDVEVLMSAGKRPTLACAVSSEAWYGWVSKPVANCEEHKCFETVNYEDLIPLETDENDKSHGDLSRPKIIVGHNVSYDRAKIKEQYWLNKTGLRFMDTMSMHTCVSGVTSYQRTVLKSKTKEPHPSDDDWIGTSSLNSLAEVHKLYCGTPIDKETRDIFVEGKLEDVHENFQKVMHYCASDVTATLSVLRKLLPLFLERFPHPATLAGMLELGIIQSKVTFKLADPTDVGLYCLCVCRSGENHFD